MIHVLASIRVKEGRRAEFLEIFKANVPAVLQEKGCVEYAPTVDVVDHGNTAQALDSNIVTIIEKWESLAHLNAHAVAPHMLAYKEKVKDIVIDVSLKILGAA